VAVGPSSHMMGIVAACVALLNMGASGMGKVLIKGPLPFPCCIADSCGLRSGVRAGDSRAVHFVPDLEPPQLRSRRRTEVQARARGVVG